VTRERGFRHEALIYSDVDAFLAAVVPFLRASLEAGEPALVAVRRQNTALLEGELGEDAAAVRFADMEALGRNPARIIPFWRGFVDQHGDRPVRGVGEPVWPGREAAEIDECQRHEALLDVAFAEPPAWSLLCPYDEGGLDDEVLSQVACSHRVIERDGVREEVAGDGGGRDCFAGSLPSRPAGSDAFRFDRVGLFDVRQRVGWAARSAGLSARAATDLVVAASELAANSIVHGGGGGALHIWRQPDRLLVEIEDRGSLENPLAGRERPPPTQVGGRGLWIANQVCDLVQIRSGASGTTVRLGMEIG
jgi:anti-sigma regulatory factor (Ser/Thr protein kinase)